MLVGNFGFDWLMMLNENETKEVKNIDHIILSEFDIDKGSMIKVIHPKSNNFDQKYQKKTKKKTLTSTSPEIWLKKCFLMVYIIE